MFKDWAEVQSCHHQTKRCRITQVANWDTDIPAQNHMAVITNSWVSNNENVRIADDHAVGILTLIWEKELHYDSCTPEAKKAIDFYNEQHADGPEYCHPPQKARHFENVKAPEITLHAEFNNTVKNQNFAFAVGYNVDPQPYLDWYFSLDEDVREARHKEIFTSANFFHWSKEACKMTVDMDDSGDLEHLTPIRKFYDWCHVDYTNKENYKFKSYVQRYGNVPSVTKFLNYERPKSPDVPNTIDEGKISGIEGFDPNNIIIDPDRLP